MCQQDKLNYKETIAFCIYCKSPIYKGDSYIVVDDYHYHYSKEDRLLNCYFLEDDEE